MGAGICKSPPASLKRGLDGRESSPREHRSLAFRSSHFGNASAAIAVLTCRQSGGKQAGDGRFDRVFQRPLRACEHCDFQFFGP